MTIRKASTATANRKAIFIAAIIVGESDSKRMCIDKVAQGQGKRFSVFLTRLPFEEGIT